LRGREAIRAQSAILNKDNTKPLLLLAKTALLVRMFSIRTNNAVGARSAQERWRHSRVARKSAGGM